jgi:hypothetical protein
VFTRGRSANTVPVHPPVLSSINVASADYDTASSQTDSSDSMSSDFQNVYDPPVHRSHSSKNKKIYIYTNKKKICYESLNIILKS